MFGNAFTGWHALIILLVILLLFGAPKLPALARSLGQSMKILKNEVRSDADGDADAADGTVAKSETTAADQSATTPSAPASSATSAAAPADPAKRTDAGPSA